MELCGTGGGRRAARPGSYNMIDIWKLRNNPQSVTFFVTICVTDEHEAPMRLAIAEAERALDPR